MTAPLLATLDRAIMEIDAMLAERTEPISVDAARAGLRLLRLLVPQAPAGLTVFITAGEGAGGGSAEAVQQQDSKDEAAAMPRRGREWSPEQREAARQRMIRTQATIQAGRRAKRAGAVVRPPDPELEQAPPVPPPSAVPHEPSPPPPAPAAVPPVAPRNPSKSAFVSANPDAAPPDARDEFEAKVELRKGTPARKVAEEFGVPALLAAKWAAEVREEGKAA